jgi:hypothetical protein
MKLLDIVFASRPMLQIPVWTVYLVALHYHHQLSGKQFALSNLSLLACLTLLSSGAFYLNQVYDYDSDVINNKSGFLQRGLLSSGQLMVAFVAVSVPAVVAGIFFSFATVFVFVQLFALSYFYSVPPLRMKDRPLAGFFANAWGHGFLVSFAVMPEITQHNAGLLGWDNPVYFFLVVGSTYFLKRTVGVIFGRTITLLISIIFCFAAAWTAWNSQYIVLLVLAIIQSVLTLLTTVIKYDSLLNLTIKLPILLLTLLAAFFYPLYLLFIVALIIGTKIYYLRRFNLDYPRLI